MPLFFINYPLETFTPTQSGALATIIYEVCRRAQTDGLEPTVITTRSDAPTFPGIDTHFIDFAEPTRPLAVKVARARRKLAGWRHLHHHRYAARVARALRQLNAHAATLILFNDPELTVYLRRRFPNARLVHWFQNQHDCKPRFRAAFGTSADLILAVSSFTAQWVERFYQLPPNSVRIIPNGVDTSLFTPAQAPPDGPPVINFVGRTGIEKGPDVLLQAALNLTGRTTNFSLQLLGSNHWDRFELDAYQQKLQSLAQALERKGVPVRRPGHIGRSALPAELRRAHIHVVPARWDEPFGMTTIEGMASGLATVASRTGGTPEVVGDAAMLFDRESVDALSQHLELLLTNPSARHDLALRARRRAELFDWSHTWSRLRETLAL
ncbi:MAG TPA: glycosyltransferase family 4 protein [Phycisphaerae bacterium]|nr:glycosyltransferase family 4 protein [Phycisphaerae bacterium]